jgi:EAL domain-containing protein (putative c-di-GMP-specific phosphodiesterase class I)
MCERSQDALIIEAVITLAHSLGMSTIAGGVETPAQLEALRRSRCDSAQGYLMSRPTPGEQVPVMLTAAHGLTAGPVGPLPRTH